MPVLVAAERLGGQVEVDAARERVGDDERRRGEVVRLHLRMDARLEVAVAGEDGADDELAVVHRLGDLGREWPRVADAGRAAVADGVEAERLEERRQARLVVVLGHDLGTRREARLHPRLAGEAALDRVLREQPGGDHDRRVGGVRAARDRGDDDRAVLRARSSASPIETGTTRGSGAAPATGSGSSSGRRRVPGLREVGRVAGRERVRDRLVLGAVAIRDAEGRERLQEGRLRLGQRHPVLRAPRAGEARLDVAEVELDDLRVLGRRVRVVEEALHAAVGLDELDLLRARGR